MKNSFVMYRSFVEAMEDLPPEDFKAAMIAISKYALDGEECTATGVAKIMFLMAKPIIDSNTQRYQNGCKGGRPKKTETDGYEEEKPTVSETETYGYETEKPTVSELETVDGCVDEDVDVNEEIKKREVREKKRFVPPTVDDVREYCQQRGYQIDPETFVDFYASKGWKVGNSPMKDWKACVRTWVKRTPKETARSGTTQPGTRQYDWEELERSLILAQRA